MSNLEAARKERSALRSSFSKSSKKVQDLVIKVTRSEDENQELTALWELLETRYQEVCAKNLVVQEIMAKKSSIGENELCDELEQVDEFALAFYKLKSAVGKILHNPEPDLALSVHSSGSNSTKSKYKLPVLKLRQFGGDLGDWLPFWAQFSKIDEDESIDAVDKLGYLSQAMIEDSPAKELVDSYPGTRQMYPAVVKALKERFGRNDLLTEYYIRELLKIILQNTRSNDKFSIAVLHDRLQCHLRNLNELGVTSENCAPILMPLVSSCLPEDLLKIWERNCAPNVRVVEGATSKHFLESLMTFLRTEVEGAQKVELAKAGFGLSALELNDSKANRKRNSTKSEATSSCLVPTATELLTSSRSTVRTTCIFCSGNSHNSQDCIKAQSLTLDSRRDRVTAEKACFCCLVRGHSAKWCSSRPRCVVCGKPHFAILCAKLPSISEGSKDAEHVVSQVSSAVKNDEVLSSVSNNCNVLMQTLVVNVRGKNGLHRARLLIDSASHRSYVLTSTATKAGYEPIRQEDIQHSLFGGKTTGIVNHNVYKLCLSSLDGSYNCNFDVLDQPKICGQISTVVKDSWIGELVAHNIYLSDMSSSAEIEILVGADVAARLWTGRKLLLSSGLVAMETKLGWTLSGKVPVDKTKILSRNNFATVVISMVSQETSITDLWSLDILGITDPLEKQAKAELEAMTQQHFLETVSVTDDGRIEVHLPWVANHPPLPTNYGLSLKRLHTLVKKLQSDGYYEPYQVILDEWLRDKVIEEVPPTQLSLPSHYLPHRHVIKLGSTTPVRPVFDASSKEGHNPSLNQCLEKGPNLIEKIPSVLAKFRLHRVGVVGDIKRAFLQIGVGEMDRNFLRFLWIDKDGDLKIFRHRRVVFGVSPSPFLLESCIRWHIDQVLESSEYPKDLVEILANSFYVDNCVTSLGSEAEVKQFIEVASSIMKKRHFDLRGWEFSSSCDSPNPTNVLGLQWDRTKDVLKINVDNLASLNTEKITKKVLLSAAHRIFDPIGVTCGVALIPKLLVQQTWSQGLTWEQEVNDDIKKAFFDWLQDIPFLEQVEIPRWVLGSDVGKENCTLHVFTDACKTSYAAAVFLRIEHCNIVRVQLLTAKSRVAPTTKTKRGMTIPRLELLAASIGARLYTSAVQDFNLSGVDVTFWTDATTVLAWIQRSEPWDTFVMNRIREIRSLTSEHKWRYVPGQMNPADPPSRGFPAKKLLQTRWWEGPQWIKEPSDTWPTNEIWYNEEEINIEKKKCVVSSLFCGTEDQDWYYRSFSSYKKSVRLLGWIERFKINCQRNSNQRTTGNLTAEEYEAAQKQLLLLVQQQSFAEGILSPKLKTLLPFIDQYGILRLKTKVSNREDSEDFCHPIVLPSDHPVVHRLVMDVHQTNCHAGTQMMMSLLRQQFWILGGRHTVRRVIGRCVHCRRHRVQRFETVPTALPETRVRDARVFEIIGVDFAGPVLLKSDDKSSKKAWICIFTCGVYRAVRFELVSSLSSDAFLLAFRRFCGRQGRPRIVYSDHGTNFIGFNNACQKLDWNVISSYSSAQRIDWRFNPPSSPWWGGWWERLLGVLKGLLRRVLGRSSVTFEEMLTILSDCESVINSRPLTYFSDNPNDLVPLTPNMFLQDLEEVGLPDCDQVEASDLRKRVRYRQQLKNMLRERFRNEYLGQLQLFANKKEHRAVRLGEIVLVGSDGSKRLGWPLGRIVALIKGHDGVVRVARVVTANGELVRPVQRLYPLELDVVDEDMSALLREASQGSTLPNQETDRDLSVDGDPVSDTEVQDNDAQRNLYTTEDANPTTTRHGRIVRRPSKLDL